MASGVFLFIRGKLVPIELNEAGLAALIRWQKEERRRLIKERAEKGGGRKQ